MLNTFIVNKNKRGNGEDSMKYTFKLRQHIGVPSEPAVKPGDKVQRGEKIAKRPKESLGANIFSSVDGVVTEVDDDHIIVEEENTDFSKYVKLSGQTPKELVEESGLVGLGGAGFPTYVKMNFDFGGEGVLVVNAAECEPILSHNIARIEDEPEKLIEAMKIVMETVHAVRGIIGIKKIHEKAIERLKEVIDDSTISIHELQNIYPMGEERALLRETIGILLEPEKFPSDAKAVVLNVETLYRLREAVLDKKPLMDKDMTVAGKLTENGSIHVFFDIPIGTSVESVIEKAGGIGSEYGEIIMGGPFTGKRTYLDQPVIKTTGGIIVAETFWQGPKKIGLLVCACGGDEARLREQAASMGSEVVGVEFCKQARQVKGTRKCENPGICPGQVQKVLKLKKAGVEGLLISNCTDCSNTVMSCAPQLKLPVYHCTDGAMRSVNKKLIRKFKETS